MNVKHQLSPTMSLGGDADNAVLSKAYLACPDFQGLDNLLLHALLIKTTSDLYESALSKSTVYLLVPTDLI